MSAQPCIVLAGGLGTRLRGAVPDLPKCLAPVAGRPFLEWQLQGLERQGVDRFVLSLGHQADRVASAVHNFNVAAPIECVIESEPLGTGGAVLHAMRQVGLHEALAVNGDTDITAELGAMLLPLDLHGGERARLSAVRVADRARYGGVELDANTVLRFVEKGRRDAGLINAGLYRLHLSAFEGLVAGTRFSMEMDVMPRLLPARALRAAVLEGTFIDIGVPEDYHRYCALRASTL
jgi:D-glycero-alpha-D-manno-heptose 1-phosphate guanylyltransferase